MLHLEKFSYYQHLSLSGGQDRPIHACRIVDIRGTRFHVLSRIQDAGLDFTGRTNFLAHHLVCTPDEIRKLATPPMILAKWPGWMKSWSNEPQLLENEDWSSLVPLADHSNVPAQTWRRITGDALNGYGLLEARAGASFRVDDLDDKTLLQLIAESMELLEVRDARRDFRTIGWNYTFTTSMQEQDNPADFRWRCIHSDNPAAARFAGPDCRALSAVRAVKCTAEETAFGRTGRKPPQFIAEPQDICIVEGETARFSATAEGIPTPTFQWSLVDRNNNGSPLPNETKPDLIVSNARQGVTRYIVSAANSSGNAQSRVAKLSVETKLKLSPSMPPANRSAARQSADHVKSGDQIERQRRQIASDEAQEFFIKKSRQRKMFGVLAFGLCFVMALAITLSLRHRRNSDSHGGQSGSSSTNTQTLAEERYVTTNTNPLSGDVYENRPLLADSNPLPAPWTQRDIGQDGPSSTAYLKDKEAFDLRGGGKNIFGTVDNFLFLSRALSNSVSFMARLGTSQVETNSRRGIMIRGSEVPNAPFIFVGLSQVNHQLMVDVLQRNSTGADCASLMRTPVWSNDPGMLYLFFRIIRQGMDFSASYSQDGINWVNAAGTNEINMPKTNYLVGFAVCSGDNTNSVSAAFDDCSITQQ